MRIALFAFTLAVVGAAPAGASAQAPGIDLQLVPKIGFYSPASDLYEAAEAGVEIVEDRGGSLALGLGVEVALPVLPVGLRVGFDYVTNSEFTVQSGTEQAAVEQSMIAVTGDLVLRPLPRLIVAEPYLLAGAGVKQYDFQFADASAGMEAFDEAANDFTLHGGIGLDIGLGPLALVAEVSDYISWFEAEGAEDAKIQHDLFFMGGIRVGLF